MSRPLLFVALAATLLLGWTPLPVSVSPEVSLDAGPLDELRASHPGVAATEEGAFIVAAQGMYDHGGWIAGYANFGAFLDHDGAASRESEFLGGGSPAAVASSGRGFLVAWQTGSGTHLLRYTAAGERIDGQPIVIGDGEVTDVAWTGSEYVVIRVSSGGFIATRIAEDGRVLQEIPVTQERIASRNGVSVLAGSRGGPIAVQTLAGDLAGPANAIGNGTEIDIAAGDPGFLVTWRSGSDILGRLLDPSGRPMGSLLVIGAYGAKPVAVWTGSEWLVAFESNGSIRAVHAAPGAVGQSLLISQSGANVSVAANASTVFIAWEEGFGIRSAAFADGQVTPLGSVHRTRATQTSHVMTTVGEATLLVWNDGTNHARRMDGVAGTQSVAQTGRPVALASRGSEALLVLHDDYSKFSFIRVDRNGTTLSTTEITRPEGVLVRDARAAWVGDSYLVVWPQSGKSGYQLYSVRVSTEGVLLGAPKPFANVSGVGNPLTLVAAGDTAVVTWPLGSAPNVPQAFLLRGDTATNVGLLPRAARVATDGTDYLITSIRRESSGDVLEWNRLLRTRQRLAGSSLKLAQQGLTERTFWTGENYLTVLWSATDRIEFSGLRLASDGTRIDAAPVPFATAPTGSSVTRVALSLRAPSTIDFTYYRDDHELMIAPTLVFRTLQPTTRRRSVR